MRVTSLFLVAIFLPLAVFAAQVNINTATVAELDTLPGIGPTKAQAIVNYRTEHGPFSRIEDLQKVSGIGPVTYDNLKDQVVVEGATTISQPGAPKPRYIQTQEVDPISKAETVPHEEESRAPAAVAEPTAAGAAMPIESGSRASGLLHSGWTYGFVGVLLLASGVFIFL